MNLERHLQDNITKHQLWTPQDRLLIAVSGGVDSMVLFDLINHLPKNLMPGSVGIAHINHHTRPETASEEEGVRQLAAKVQCPIYVKDWTQGGQVESAFEQTARDMRYDFFEEVMKQEGYNVLVTAHHQDDQAETVLMKLIRGGLIDEKVGMTFKRDFRGNQLVRPMLNIAKADLYQYAGDRDLPYFEDSTNDSNLYMRNRIRRQVIPVLEEENAQAQEHLAEFSDDLADLLRTVQPLVNQLTDKLAQVQEANQLMTIQIDELNDFERPVRRVLMTALLKEVGRMDSDFNFKKVYVQAILDWLEAGSPNSSLDLAQGWTCQRDYNTLVISKDQSQVSQPVDLEATFFIQMNEWVDLEDGSQIGLFDIDQVMLNQGDLVMSVPKEDLHEPLTVRHRQDGDRMTYKGGSGRKKIKDIFINQKVSKDLRDQAWLVEDSQGEILWLIGYQKSRLSNDLITDKINYIFVFRQIDNKTEDYDGNHA